MSAKIGLNAEVKFDILQKEKLGLYVYVLRDPDSKKIFYVGQGQNNRLFDHFEDARRCLEKKSTTTEKERQILEIWEKGKDVEWAIISHGLDPEKGKEIADQIESAVYDALKESKNEKPYNDNLTPHSTFLSSMDARMLGAKQVDPTEPYDVLFIFPIHKGLAEGRTIYEATRKSWAVSPKFRDRPAFAVGLKNGISVGSFEIERWEESEEGKFMFTGSDYPALLNKAWKKLITFPGASGHWSKGNYLIVKLDGKGNACFLKGAKDKRMISLGRTN
jgi:hypothetical protein